MKIRALALLSGGLDSSLAVKLIQEQGIEVEGISFTSPFFGPENAKKAAEELGINLYIRDVSSEILEIIKNPRYGYGKNMNPCIDCHILMAQKAKEEMLEAKASFIISGEVVGQRPRSQNKQILEAIAKRADILGKLLRPLSAKLLPITDPEKRGSINREKLLALSGKSRKPQLELARRYNLKEYGTPAGGCLLTDSIFSRRLKDLLEHNEYTLDNILLLKLGRHFRSSTGLKIVIGRNKEENKKLKALAKGGDASFNVIGHKGPLAIVRGNLPARSCPAPARRSFGAGGEAGGDAETLEEAASLCARYSDGKESPRVKVSYKRLPDGKIKSIIVTPVDATELGITRI
ncbi:tRNA 4-thiouridine(8) synthase ThiI [bacterium]|nr:tRNA 4-thiouridine(8) synthase ThiI [bacterium]MBU4560870.1 tRNA 4-thiouridine(8) synthase ThiI [bacterium]MCG2676587.1 tRNA 4-thiouridine(8) synthase ThiI [bacterium]